MPYNNAYELILTESKQLKYVHKNEKAEFFDELHRHFNESLQKSGHIVRTNSPRGHALTQAIDKASFYSNLLALMDRKYLFISNFNAGQTNWINEDGTVSWNIVAQLIPVIYKKWYPDSTAFVLRPKESKHRGVIHDLYEKYYPKNFIIDGGPQYRVGRTPEGSLYNRDSFRADCVVLLDVATETPSTLGDFIFKFQKYLISNLIKTRILDINFNHEPRVFGNKVSLEEEIATIFSIRAQWDERARTYGRDLDFEKMINHTSLTVL